jgi:hypothetical protein
MRNCKTPLRSLTLVALASVCVLAAIAFAPAHSAAQTRHDTATWEPKKPATPKAAPKAKPRPVVRHAPPPHGALLSAQYRVLKINANDAQVEVSPVTVFNAGDRVRFGFKANADAYLYIIWQPGVGQPGRMFVPDSRFNGGLNNVSKNQEFIVPGACLPSVLPFDCAHAVTSTGQELFTIILSRSPTLSLFNQAGATGGSIDARWLDNFIRSSAQRLDAARRGDTVFAVRYNNLNPRADDQIVLQYTLNKK